MSSTTSYSNPTLKPLTQTAHRLTLLTHALSSLHNSLTVSAPLPDPASLQKSLQLLSHRLTTLSTFLAQPDVHAALAGASVYPLPNFAWAKPGGANEGILGQLLRKKLDPSVEGWVNSAETIPESAKAEDDVEALVLDAKELEELWKWAKPRAGELAASMPWGTDYSVSERETGIESVVTGIRQALNAGDESGSGSDDDEDEDEDESGDESGETAAGKMQGVRKTLGGNAEGKSKSKFVPPEKPMVPLEDILRFMSSGAAPRVGMAGARPAGFATSPQS